MTSGRNKVTDLNRAVFNDTIEGGFDSQVCHIQLRALDLSSRGCQGAFSLGYSQLRLITYSFKL